MFSVTAEYFNFLVERNKKIFENEQEHLDPLILPSLKVINKTPGLATAWSCQGHGGNKTGPISRYVVLAIHPSETQCLQYFSKILSDTTPEEDFLYLPSVEFVRLYSLDSIGNQFNDRERHTHLKFKMKIPSTTTQATKERYINESQLEAANVFWDGVFDRIYSMSINDRKNILDTKNLNPFHLHKC